MLKSGPDTGKKPRQNLTQKVVKALKQRIRAGDIKPGDKLPTEQKLTEEFNVSRTVIREAISGLKADGLLASRQGAGIFALEPKKKNETLELLSENPRTITSVIEALELRVAIEIGAAELAARRCSPGQEADIYACFNAFKKKVAAGEVSEQEDFAFHQAIVEATHNPHFQALSEHLEHGARRVIRQARSNTKSHHADMVEAVQEEHKTIYDAIVASDPERAAQAAETHLRNAAKRLNMYLKG